MKKRNLQLRRSTQRRGFSTVEVVVSSAVLVGSMLASVSVQLSSQRLLQESQETNIAVSALRSSLEIAMREEKDTLVGDYQPGEVFEEVQAEVETEAEEPTGQSGKLASLVESFLRAKGWLPSTGETTVKHNNKRKLNASLDRLKGQSMSFDTPSHSSGGDVPDVLDMGVTVSWTSRSGTQRSLRLTTAKR